MEAVGREAVTKDAARVAANKASADAAKKTPAETAAVKVRNDPIFTT